MAGAREGDVAEEVLVQQSALAVGFEVDGALLEPFALAVGEDRILPHGARELALVQADEERRVQRRAARAINLADENLIDCRRREREVELLETGLEDLREVADRDGLVAEEVDHLVEQGDELRPDLLVLAALFELVGV